MDYGGTVGSVKSIKSQCGIFADAWLTLALSAYSTFGNGKTIKDNVDSRTQALQAKIIEATLL